MRATGRGHGAGGRRGDVIRRGPPVVRHPRFRVEPRGHRRSRAVFFFSSRRRHTRFDCDWSSDVCSSDLGGMSYNQAIKADHDFTVDNVDAALNAQHLDAIVSATDNPAWATDLVFGDHFIFGTSSIAAAGGYPIVQVPAGEVFGVPLGISFFGTAFSEPKLIKLASGYESF